MNPTPAPAPTRPARTLHVIDVLVLLGGALEIAAFVLLLLGNAVAAIACAAVALVAWADARLLARAPRTGGSTPTLASRIRAARARRRFRAGTLQLIARHETDRARCVARLAQYGDDHSMAPTWRAVITRTNGWIAELRKTLED